MAQQYHLHHLPHRRLLWHVQRNRPVSRESLAKHLVCREARARARNSHAGRAEQVKRTGRGAREMRRAGGVSSVRRPF
eukprot:4287326-Prymnesium_polylepis.1